MTNFEYVERHGNKVKLGVSEQHVEVGAEPNVIVDDMELSSKEKPLLCSLD